MGYMDVVRGPWSLENRGYDGSVISGRPLLPFEKSGLTLPGNWPPPLMAAAEEPLFAASADDWRDGVIELSALDGINGFTINGIDANDNSGISVASAGDVNGDGIGDLIIGAYGAAPGGRGFAGESYVVFGSAAGFAAGFDLSALDGGNGFTINGTGVADLSGYSVASAGDVNGDGIDDLIIGAYGSDPNGQASAGASYVVFGGTGGFAAGLDLSTLDGTNGFAIYGIDASDNSGFSVASAGDVNGDGIDDLIIGAYLADPGGRTDAGESYVVFGSAAGFAAGLDLSALDGGNGFVINGAIASDNSGFSVASAGDVNGDGIGDLIIGAYLADPGGRNAAGESYVVFGSAAGFAAALDLSALDGGNGFIISGIDAFDQSGYSVASAGDVNGDGIDDLIIGANIADPGGRSGAGETYVVFGSAGGFAASLDLSTLDGGNGFVINGIDAFDLSGYSVASAGDVNGDGIGDLIIGAVLADPGGRGGAGETYVVFGSAGGFAASLDLSALDGSNGFVIDGIDADDASGISVAGAGDVNGDGYDDLIIGAINADPGGRSNAGESYIVYGHTSNQTEGTSGDDILLGARGEDTLNGYQGNDTLIGSGSADTMSGGTGDDYYDHVTSADTVVELAGEGTDTIRTRFDGYLPNHVENLILFGSIAETGVGNGLANRITGTSGDNTLYGFGGDDVFEGRGGNDTLHGGAGDDIYDIVTAADTVVELADEGIDTVSTRADSYVLGDNVENLILSGHLAEIGSGNALANQLTGSNRSNILFGFDGDDLLQGLGGVDTLDGGAGNDTLEGGTGNDNLAGGSGNDTLIGGAGRDVLTGGTDADIFAFFDEDFASLASSTDRIADFSRSDGDRIDLSALDAMMGTPENESFAFIGAAAFSGAAGELRCVQRNGFAVIQGDTNGDGLADFGIRVDGLIDLTAADFML